MSNRTVEKIKRDIEFAERLKCSVNAESREAKNNEERNACFAHIDRISELQDELRKGDGSLDPTHENQTETGPVP